MNMNNPEVPIFQPFQRTINDSQPPKLFDLPTKTKQQWTSNAQMKESLDSDEEIEEAIKHFRNLDQSIKCMKLRKEDGTTYEATKAEFFKRIQNIEFEVDSPGSLTPVEDEE